MVVTKADVTADIPASTDLIYVNDGETVEADTENSNNSTVLGPLIVAMNWIIDQGLQAGVESIATALQRFQGGIKVDDIDSETAGSDITLTTTSTGKFKYQSGTVAASEVLTTGNYASLVTPVSGVTVMTGATNSVNGTQGLAPQPDAGEQNLPLRGNATYSTGWELKSSNFTIENGGKYIVGSAVTAVTLPNSPAVNYEFELVAGSGTSFGTVTLTAAASGEFINGSSGNLLLDTEASSYKGVLVNTGVTGIGWRLDVGQQELPVPTTVTSSIKTADFTAADNNRYFVASDTAITATLPAVPVNGNRVQFVDYYGGFNVNNLTIGRNSKTINFYPADLTVDVANDTTTLQYVTSTDLTPATNTKSIIFGGTNEYVDCGNDTSVQTTGAFSVFYWMNTGQVQAQNESTAIAGKWTASGNQKAWWMGLVRLAAGSGTSKLAVQLSANGSAIAKYYYTATDLTDSSWHHVGFTYDGNNTLTVYLDGAVESVTKTTDTAMTTVHNSTANLKLGSALAGYTRDYYTGSMDEFTLYGKALTATEVASLYTYGAWPLRGGLKAWYRCGDGDTYPTLTDNTANGNDGTMTNMESGDLQTADPSISNFQSEGDTWVVVE